jgi:hypothetical protein
MSNLTGLESYGIPADVICGKTIICTEKREKCEKRSMEIRKVKHIPIRVQIKGKKDAGRREGGTIFGPRYGRLGKTQHHCIYPRISGVISHLAEIG